MPPNGDLRPSVHGGSSLAMLKRKSQPLEPKPLTSFPSRHHFLESHGYTVVKQIGKGSFGRAMLVRGVDKAEFVVKEVKVGHLCFTEKELARMEIKVLRTLGHPNVVRYIDHFEDGTYLYIVMEYADSGDLGKVLKAATAPLSEPRVMDYFVQICMALQHLHGRQVLHRDLKPSNVFLATNKKLVKLGDFGISTILNGSQSLAKTQCGTPYYFSPEVCQKKFYDQKSDVWSLGCLLYEMLTLRRPFTGTNLATLMANICRGHYVSLPSHYSPELQQLLKSMLSHDPSGRPSMSTILEMPFIRHHVDDFLASTDGSGPPAQSLAGPSFIMPPSRSLPIDVKPRDMPLAADGPFEATDSAVRVKRDADLAEKLRRRQRPPLGLELQRRLDMLREASISPPATRRGISSSRRSIDGLLVRKVATAIRTDQRIINGSPNTDGPRAAKGHAVPSEVLPRTSSMPALHGPPRASSLSPKPPTFRHHPPLQPRDPKRITRPTAPLSCTATKRSPRQFPGSILATEEMTKLRDLAPSSARGPPLRPSPPEEKPTAEAQQDSQAGPSKGRPVPAKATGRPPSADCSRKMERFAVAGCPARHLLTLRAQQLSLSGSSPGLKRCSSIGRQPQAPTFKRSATPPNRWRPLGMPLKTPVVTTAGTMQGRSLSPGGPYQRQIGSLADGRSQGCSPLRPRSPSAKGQSPLKSRMQSPAKTIVRPVEGLRIKLEKALALMQDRNDDAAACKQADDSGGVRSPASSRGIGLSSQRPCEAMPLGLGKSSAASIKEADEEDDECLRMVHMIERALRDRNPPAALDVQFRMEF